MQRDKESKQNRQTARSRKIEKVKKGRVRDNRTIKGRQKQTLLYRNGEKETEALLKRKLEESKVNQVKTLRLLKEKGTAFSDTLVLFLNVTRSDVIVYFTFYISPQRQ